MQSKLNPYIGFSGNARQAMEFYKGVFGGELTMTTYAEGGMPEAGDGSNNIMHAMLVSENGFVLMGSDTPDGMSRGSGSNISISLSGDNEQELTAYWGRLSEGATVQEPLVMAPWGDTFGMLTDKFGVGWMVNIAGKKG
jgi:PhnB protein